MIKVVLWDFFLLYCSILFYNPGHLCRNHILSSNLTQWQLLNRSLYITYITIYHITPIYHIYYQSCFLDPKVTGTLWLSIALYVWSNNDRVRTRSELFFNGTIYNYALIWLLFLLERFVSKKFFFEGIQK